MVDAEQNALKKGKNRKEAIMAAYDRFYKGDIAKEFVRGCQEQGGLNHYARSCQMETHRGRTAECKL